MPYILVSFEDAPPAIFWTRSWPSSVLSSSSCFLRSEGDLPQSWAALTFAEDDCGDVSGLINILSTNAYHLSELR
jgi:hypothetical protein